MADALSRLDGVVKVEMNGKEALVSFDPQSTNKQQLIKSFNESREKHQVSEV